MKFLNFGSLNIDFTYQVKNFVRKGETIASSSVSKHAGGKGFNQSIALSRAGAQVYHAGCIGEDGLFLRDMLEASVVNTTYLKVLDVPTGNAIIQVDSSGDNCILLYAGANHCITEEYIDLVLDNFGRDDVLVIQNEINSLEYLADRAYEKGLRIAVNPSPINSNVTENILKKASWILVNQGEAEALAGVTGKDACIARLAEFYPGSTLVMTLGASGVVCWENGALFSQAAYKTQVVDTTGAGDTFTGFYLAEVLSGSTQEEALRTASAAASLSISKCGAAESIPSMAEVKAMLK